MKKFVMVLFFIIFLTGAVSIFIFYNQLQQETTEFEAIQKRIYVVNNEIIETKNKISDLEKQNEILEKKVNNYKNALDEYTKEIESVTGAKNKVLNNLQEKRLELASLQEGLTGLTAERDELQTVLDEMIALQQKSKNEMDTLNSEKRTLETDIKSYLKPKQGVELEKIVVKMSNYPEGNILEVNDNYGFAIVDLGINAGLMVGDILGVYRNNELVSKVVADKVFDDFSSVVPAEGFIDLPLKISDRVSLIK